MVGHVTAPAAAILDSLPAWATLVRAPNPGPMTLDGTNTWLLRAPGSSAGYVVVDPGPLDEAHLRAVADHGPIEGILITHGHFDHTEGVPRLAEITGAPVLDRAGTYEVGGLGIRVIETPGHSSDSVCYVIDDEAVLSGDTILGRGTTIVAWPDGDLASYLTSLDTLEGLGPVPVLPGHGPALADCAAASVYYRTHREARLEQVRAAVDAGAAEAMEVVRVVYADVDRVLWPAAEATVRAQLAYLEEREKP
ncbi:MBL fold metallo-hydrolase [Virgisporangium ochraceum]|uniref:MBL fold metallo-hydrolase n=1 Tax=Virgisporangium ochraceum TaxID=65505 RepID=A0A8J4A6C6_9ACTN|nr:MBL fold metallo-hydrolase [Virgisporangium ochraceum]GIJ74685.1 MBL fold metallo-hydrolase [Virgisporangium ochraceum]